MDEPTTESNQTASAEMAQLEPTTTMDVDDAPQPTQGYESTADTAATTEKPANTGEEDGIAPEAMEIHDIDESHAATGEHDDDLDKSVAPSEKSMDQTLLNSSAIDPFDSLRNTTTTDGGDKEQTEDKGSEDKSSEKVVDDAANDNKEKKGDGEGSDAAEDVELPKLPEVDEDSGPAGLDRDAATPDLEDLEEPEASNQADYDTRDNSPGSPARDYDDDAPAEGKCTFKDFDNVFLSLIGT